jgi:hypothetical protein
MLSANRASRSWDSMFHVRAAAALFRCAQQSRAALAKNPPAALKCRADCFLGDPDTSRTCDAHLRRVTLYPLSYRAVMRRRGGPPRALAHHYSTTGRRFELVFFWIRDFRDFSVFWIPGFSAFRVFRLVDLRPRFPADNFFTPRCTPAGVQCISAGRHVFPLYIARGGASRQKRCRTAVPSAVSMKRFLAAHCPHRLRHRPQARRLLKSAPF